MSIKNTYKYKMFLDTETKTPDLDLKADLTNSYIGGNFRSYVFEVVPVSGSYLIDEIINYIIKHCKTYKLIVVGEDPGHIEIYKSEDYAGTLGVAIIGEVSEALWPKE